jgi:uncharacterized integral membrane protein
MTTATKAKLVGAIVIVVLIVMVFLQNGDPVRFKFLFFTIEIAKTLLILGSMVVGVVGTLVVQLFWRQRKRLRETQDSGLGTQSL